MVMPPAPTRRPAESARGLPAYGPCDPCLPARTERVHRHDDGSLECSIKALAQEMAALREDLTKVSESQVIVRDSVAEVLDGVCSLQGRVVPRRTPPEPANEPKALDPPTAPPEVAAPHDAGCPPPDLTVPPDTRASHGPGASRGLRATQHSRRSYCTTKKLSGPGIQGYLYDMVHCAEELQEAEARRAEDRKHMAKCIFHALRTMTPAQCELHLDTVMLGVVVLNAIFQGFQTSGSTTTWLITDALFTLAFVVEVCIKLRFHGFRGHFCGPMRLSSFADVILITVDVCYLILVIAFPAALENGAEAMPAASLLRLLRLFKLARLLRVLKMEGLKDLLNMIQGMIGGFHTLAWAMVLFCFVIYLSSLLFVEFFGKHDVEHVYVHFNTVGRSMFTTFRCAFGDCTTIEGQPIFDHVRENYGPIASFFCCCFVFVVSVGIMNVITANFVESTMAAAAKAKRANKTARMHDTDLWNSRIVTLVRLLASHTGVELRGMLSEQIQDLCKLQVPSEVIDRVVRTPEGCQALCELDVFECDHEYLSDILDADQSCICDVTEFIDGIRRLRGEPRRSDIVCVDLMVRDIQRQVRETLQAVREFGNR